LDVRSIGDSEKPGRISAVLSQPSRPNEELDLKKLCAGTN